MKLSEIIFSWETPVGILIGMNLREYVETKKWMEKHGVDTSWHDNSCRERADSYVLEYFLYYLCMPGRKLAYFQNKAKKNKN